MSDKPEPKDTNPSPDGAPLISKGVLITGGLLAAVVVGAGGYLYLVSKGGDGTPAWAQEREPRGGSTAGKIGSRWNPDEAAADARVPEPEPERQNNPFAESAQTRVRARVQPSGFGFDARYPPKPEKASGGPQIGPDGRPMQRTIAGLPVLEAEGATGTEFMLTPGTEIMCNNVQPLHNQEGARFSAKIPYEIRNDDNTRVLIPKGSIAVGRVMKKVEAGEMRISSALTHIIGPKPPYNRRRLVVPLGAAQAGDELGGAGLPANVTDRPWARFGTVAAYAALDLTTRIGSSMLVNGLEDAINGGGSQTDIDVNIGRFGNGGMARSLAGKVLDHELQKPLGVQRPQAHPCTIFIEQFIDFEKYLKQAGML